MRPTAQEIEKETCLYCPNNPDYYNDDFGDREYVCAHCLEYQLLIKEYWLPIKR